MSRLSRPHQQSGPTSDLFNFIKHLCKHVPRNLIDLQAPSRATSLLDRAMLAPNEPQAVTHASQHLTSQVDCVLTVSFCNCGNQLPSFIYSKLYS